MSEGPGAAMYQQAILDHYKNPRHYGSLDPHTVKHLGENPLCGDALEVTLVLAADDTIEAAKFSGQGCAISQAATDILLDDIVGRPVDEVVAMGTDGMLELLGIQVSSVREKCAVLGLMIVKDGLRVHRGEIDPLDVTRTEE